MSPANLLTPGAAAERLGITERHLRELTYRRRIPFVKVGQLVRFKPADLDRYIADRTVEAAS